MNAALAALYNKTKTASDAAATPTEPEVDLNQVSAADFLKAIEAHDAANGGAGDTVDLSTLSAQELIELSERVANAEASQADQETIEKMASSGELAHWDMVGRIMAHSYADEMAKVAGTDLPERIELEGLTGADLVEILESGEYEFEKTAGAGDKVMGFLKRVKGGAANAASKASEAAKGAVGAVKASPGKTIAEGGKLKAMLKNYGKDVVKNPAFLAQLKRTGKAAAPAAAAGAAALVPAAGGLAAYLASRKNKK